jgi:hypothetical protein
MKKASTGCVEAAGSEASRRVNQPTAGLRRTANLFQPNGNNKRPRFFQSKPSRKTVFSLPRTLQATRHRYWLRPLHRPRVLGSLLKDLYVYREIYKELARTRPFLHRSTPILDG